MSDMSTLRSVLADRVETLLTAADSRYSGQVAQHYREEVDSLPSRRRVLKVMGDPVRYAEVLHVQDANESTYFEQLNAAGNAMRIPQTFQIGVWRRYEDADTLSASSTDEWSSLIWDSPGGLLYKMRTETAFTSGSTTYQHNPPSPAQDVVLPLDGDGQLLAHYVEFTVEITD